MSNMKMSVNLKESIENGVNYIAPMWDMDMAIWMIMRINTGGVGIT